ncbi:hypothetical protein CHUAL_011911 [Chamberlinius hualienensis]
MSKTASAVEYVDNNTQKKTKGLLEDTDDGGLGFSDQTSPQNKRRLRHPAAAAFHVAFRLLAIIVYLFCGWFSSNFIASFVIIILLLSADFWTVKNVTGRLLVGLRWWNYIDDDGKSHWVFESRKESDQIQISAADSRIFWMALFLAPILWLVFFFVTVFGLNLKWFMVVCIALTLSGANLYGYIRCRFGQKTNISNVATNFLQQQLFKNVLTSFQQNKPAQQSTTQPV